MGRWLFVSACALLTHAAALRAGFVWLDHAHIEEKLAIAPPSRWAGLFAEGFAGTGFYRPLMALSLSIDALVGAPLAFHAVNLGWHAAASVMVVAAAEALGLSRRAATVAGVLFAVHPVAQLPAHVIAFRSEAMIVVALLGLVAAHLRGKPLLAALALFLGALSKEVALVLAPAFIVALEWTCARGAARGADAPGADARDADARDADARGAARDAARGADARGADARDGARASRRRLWIAEALAFAGALGLRLRFAPSWRAAHEPLAALDALGTRFGALAKSAGAVFFPVDRHICDAFRIVPPWHPLSLLGLAVALAVVRWALRRRGPALLLALSILPSLHLVPIMRWWSPHYAYLPLAFASMLAAEAMERLDARQSARPNGVGRANAAALGVGLLFAGITLFDGSRFGSDTALWRAEVSAQPACREGHFYLGEVERQAQRFASAAKEYEAALAPWPGVLAYVDRAAALQNLGTVFLELRRFTDAQRAFRAALAGAKGERNLRELVHDLAAATFGAGDAAEAARLLEPETARPDAFPDSLTLRALALQKLGRHEEARSLLARTGATKSP
ncbi:tetratricopeptide repeat protein [Pendulispora albinea]|uniref:Glycosyltransferase RgtA/B/C/D-like domain-containing protein n=1 Tax=Pendulispora albinea TaxID=2741071 RepID=A0ABZ2M7R9_9BACT